MKSYFNNLILSVFFAVSASQAMSDPYGIASLRSGDMNKLVVHDKPIITSNKSFDLEDFGGRATLNDWKGKYVLLNIWAPWCPPCRQEMPMLSSLQASLGGEKFEVVTISTGRDEPRKIDNFFNEIGVGNLPKHQDTSQQLARGLSVFGLPTTIIIDPDGLEIARLRGHADWNSSSSKNILKKLILN